MLESFQQLAMGFSHALQMQNLLYAFTGCLLGTVVGLLPGLGPSAAIAILIPTTAALDPTGAIIMLAAIYYGCQFGGAITAILFNTPGEAASAITCIDGHQMAKQGKAGKALAISAISSFIGGTITVVALGTLAAALTTVALRFGPPEFFSLIVLSLVLVVSLSGQSLVRGLLAATFGLILAMVGIDPVMGLPRLTLGMVELLDGIPFVPVVIGLFGIGEILLNIEDPDRQFKPAKLTSYALDRSDVRRATGPIFRGTFLGFFIGMVPGLGSAPAAFASYVTEKQVSKTPEKFGSGMIEGVAGPEAANNAAANGNMLPLLTLGIPGSGVIAILMGAFIMNGIVPGPLLFQEEAELVWTVIASMYVGNVMLLILNLPCIPIWLTILRVPYGILFPMILGFTILGAYSISYSAFDIHIMAVFGVVGYLFRKLDIPLVPVIMTLVLAPLMEGGLRRSLEMSQGDMAIFTTRPISATCLVLAVLFLTITVARIFLQRRKEQSDHPESMG